MRFRVLGGASISKSKRSRLVPTSSRGDSTCTGAGGSPVDWTREQGGSEIGSGTDPGILDELYAEVEDDGSGFDPEARVLSGGSGLKNMKQRADLLRGSLEIHSIIDQGTRILVRSGPVKLPMARSRSTSRPSGPIC